MDESKAETHFSEHHSYRLKPVILTLIGLVGGGVLFFGVMAWYFTRVDPGGGPSGRKGHAMKLPFAGDGDADFNLELDGVEVSPPADVHVTIGNGIAKNVEVPEDSGLTAILEGNRLMVSVAKDAKSGPYQVTVRDARGQSSTFNITVKR
jgi:hypothetical protein